jgi:two-component system sensor histidine kinase KdpD
MAGSELDEQDKTLLCKEINGAAERLNKLTNDLLSLSRLESGMLRPQLDWCDVRELIHTVINAQELADLPRLSVEIPGKIPLVRLDFVLMEQALRNLVLNAVKHTGESDHITVSADYQAGNLELLVRDTGEGFPSGELDNLFEKFHRLSNSRTGGVGLGLSIAKGFVEAHGGTISAYNNSGGGAQIKIVIPAASANQLMPEHE